MGEILLSVYMIVFSFSFFWCRYIKTKCLWLGSTHTWNKRSDFLSVWKLSKFINRSEVISELYAPWVSSGELARQRSDDFFFWPHSLCLHGIMVAKTEMSLKKNTEKTSELAGKLWFCKCRTQWCSWPEIIYSEWDHASEMEFIWGWGWIGSVKYDEELVG